MSRLQGELVTGILSKKLLGPAPNGLIHVLMNDVGPDGCRDFVDNIQRLVNHWLLHRGFSVGIGDSVATFDTMKRIGDTIRVAKAKVKRTVQEAQAGHLTKQPGLSMVKTFESLANVILNKARTDVRAGAGLLVVWLVLSVTYARVPMLQSGNIAAESLNENNNILAMVAAGSKGSEINISQIIACVGQQNVDGQRIPFGFRSRSLPHFAKDDLGAQVCACQAYSRHSARRAPCLFVQITRVRCLPRSPVASWRTRT